MWVLPSTLFDRVADVSDSQLTLESKIEGELTDEKGPSFMDKMQRAGQDPDHTSIHLDGANLGQGDDLLELPFDSGPVLLRIASQVPCLGSSGVNLPHRRGQLTRQLPYLLPPRRQIIGDSRTLRLEKRQAGLDEGMSDVVSVVGVPFGLAGQQAWRAAHGGSTYVHPTIVHR